MSAVRLTATNTFANDIVISQPSAPVTIGTGGWTLSNVPTAGYIIGGQIVTINSGAPSSGNMFLAAGNNIIVNGYTNTGDVGFSAGNDVNINNPLSAGNNMALAAGGHVRVNGATAVATGSVSVSAAFLDILLGGTLQAGTTMSVSASEVVVQGSEGGGLRGTEVDMTVGALIKVSSDGQIVATSAASIDILFPTLASGGFLVNTTAGVVDPLDSSTGFFVAGNQVTSLTFPGFNVTYGAVAGIDPCTLVPDLCAPPLSGGGGDPLNPNPEPTVISDDTGDPQAKPDKKKTPICGASG